MASVDVAYKPALHAESSTQAWSRAYAARTQARPALHAGAVTWGQSVKPIWPADQHRVSHLACSAG